MVSGCNSVLPFLCNFGGLTHVGDGKVIPNVKMEEQVILWALYCVCLPNVYDELPMSPDHKCQSLLEHNISSDGCGQMSCDPLKCFPQDKILAEWVI